MPYKIILASNSPRRKQLLAAAGIDFTVRVNAGVDESYPQGLAPAEVPQFIARSKAAASMVGDGELIITADTVVIVGDEILGKPADEADARRMLRMLSGRTHQVTTGVCLTTTAKQRVFAVTTDVTFKKLEAEEIDYYINNYKPYDKAGAYGIQEWIGCIGITSIRGSYFNVVGLPVQRIYEELRNMAD